MDHQAFAQLLGNYGEFVGAIAVVITLVYLSLQVRGAAKQVEQNQQAIRTQNQQSVMENFNTWRYMVLDGHNHQIWFRGINDLEALNEGEKQKFFMMAGAFDWACWYMYQQEQTEGLLNDINTQLYRDQFIHPGYRQWLLALRNYHTDDYGKFLDKVASSVGSKTWRPGEASSLSPGEY
jgi:hypothetical protein